MKSFSVPGKILLLLAFIEGGVVMAIELLGARLMAPVYGSSLEVWSIVLAVSVGALALGYFLGGEISKTVNKSFWLQFNFMLASALIVLLPFTSKYLIFDFDPDKLALFISLSSLLLLFFPLLLLGSTTPIIISCFEQSTHKPGAVSGKIYALSTCGGIFFTYITGFYLIPEKGLTGTALFAGLLMGAVPFVILILKKKFVAALLLPAALIVVLFSSKDFTSTDVKVLHHSEGLFGQLLVADIPKDFNKNNGYDRVLFLNRLGQTWVDVQSGTSIWNYPNYLVTIGSTLKPNPDVLLLGLGGGTLGRYFSAYLGARVDAVELDERMVDISKKHFNLSGVKFIVDDARHYIESSRKKYDYIVFDIYKGESPPSHTLSLEAFQTVKELLNPGALVVINFNGFVNGEEGRAGRSLLKTLENAGFFISIIPTPEEEKYRNCLYVASLHRHNLSGSTIDLNLNGAFVKLETLKLDLQQLDMSDAIVLTDNKPLLEQFNQKASKSWRNDYYYNYTQKLEERGVKLFK
jgi:spermidine synthase